MHSLLYISSCKPSLSENIMYIPLTPLQNGLSINKVMFCSGRHGRHLAVRGGGGGGDRISDVPPLIFWDGKKSRISIFAFYGNFY